MTRTRKIRVMPPDLALKIAAGEVVERPSSAVKELIDNAVDAAACSIRIDVREAGLKLIRVSDDGEGIAREDLPLAFHSHATSKISDLDDLEHLSTLGFRGEALPSLAVVSRIEVVTRTEDEALASRYTLEFGEEREVSATAAPRGTRISVFDLFSNVPARRKFVRSLRAEGGQIAAVVALYIQAQPRVQLALTLDDRPVFASPGTGKMEDALAAVHGAAILQHMHPVSWEEAGIVIEGLISTPSHTRQNRSGIALFVNGRPVANRSLGFALEEAYSGYLMTGRHPVAAVHIRLDPGDVDVNVHPSKSEVRFARDREVHGALHRAVASALLDLRLQAKGLGLDGEEEFASTTQVQAAVENGTLDGADQASLPVPDPGVPILRVFGQAHETFIIAEGPNGLYMIDQHAAHERILFDRFEEEMRAGGIPSQTLLEPAPLDITPEQMSALDDNGPLLAQLGFDLEPFGNASCLIRAVPSLRRGGSPQESVIEVLDELSRLVEPSAARERALASVACHAAVKAGQALDVHEMREIVAQLERTNRPATCPHGRPTMIHLSHAQLEREFGRR